MITFISCSHYHLNHVMEIAEIAELIMDTLALPGLITLSSTSKTNYFHTQNYIRHKLSKIFAPFGLSRDFIMIHLLATKSFIIGPIALKAVAPAIMSINTPHLDIVVPCNYMEYFEDCLTQKFGYKKMISPDKYGVVFKYSFSFTQQIDNQLRAIHLLAVGSQNDGYEAIFHMSNTANMNIISYSGLFSAHRTLLDQGLAVQNITTNMITMSNLHPHTRTRQSIIDSDNNSAIEKAGFHLIRQGIPAHWNENTTCQCIHRSACPLVVRNTNDSMCSFMRLLSDTDYEDAYIAPRLRQLPTVIWRLADNSGRATPGFAFHLTNDKIKKLV
jgi:hypothetical protein